MFFSFQQTCFDASIQKADAQNIGITFFLYLNGNLSIPIISIKK